MRQIIDRYAQNGVPEDLVAAAKRSEIAQAEFQRNSIPGLADVWSAALAAEGRTSPEEDVDAIRKVTLADVNRVAKEYLLNASTITATLKPVASGGPVAQKGFGGGETGDRCAHQTGTAAGMGGRPARTSSRRRRITLRSPTPRFPTAFA